jgi:hypothetical protein
MEIYETWTFGEGYHKVHIKHKQAYEKIKSFLMSKNDSYYCRDGKLYAWDVIVKNKELSKVKKILKEFT